MFPERGWEPTPAAVGSTTHPSIPEFDIGGVAFLPPSARSGPEEGKLSAAVATRFRAQPGDVVALVRVPRDEMTAPPGQFLPVSPQLARA